MMYVYAKFIEEAAHSEIQTVCRSDLIFQHSADLKQQTIIIHFKYDSVYFACQFNSTSKSAYLVWTLFQF